MKKNLIAAFAAAFLCGCATTGTVAERARQIYEEDGAMIQSGVSLLTSAAIQFAEQNPEKRDDLRADLNRVAAQVALLAGGNLDPAALTSALRVKEDYITRILQSVVPLYSAGYSRLKSQGEAKLAADYLKLIAQGIADASR